MRKLHEQGQTNWCSYVKNILSENEALSAWEEQNIENCKIANIKENIYKDYMSKCLNDINDTVKYPKLRSFKDFKNEYKFENYLNTPINVSHALALCRFRISSHNLRIETGRYTRPKTPPELRLCLYCTSQAVETEQHFLLDCKLYEAERQILMNTVLDFIPDLPNMSKNDQFISIMSNNNKKLYVALSKFMYTCMKKRNSQTEVAN